jgi:hypothetical protein
MSLTPQPRDLETYINELTNLINLAQTGRTILPIRIDRDISTDPVFGIR